MNFTIKITVAFVFTLINSIPIFSQTSVDFFPTTKNYSEEIVIFDYANVSQGTRLAAVSLQGLVNRDTASILMKDNLADDLFQLYIDKDIVSIKQEYTNIYVLLGDFKAFFTGAVVYDPAKPFTINLATNIAGVEDRIIISPDMVEGFKENTDNSDIKDLRDYNFSTVKDAFTWYKQNIYPSQRNTVLAVANKGYMHDVYRDYLIEFRIPTFWLPGHDDSDYDAEYENLIKTMFEETPDNIPVLGFWPDGSSNGYDEFSGVKLAGLYGKFTVVNTWVGNYSFHSAFGDNQDYTQTKVRAKIFRGYDPTKKYVALIMVESGDSPGYMQFGFHDRQWNDPYRGQVPLSYGINPSMRMLLPVMTRDIYETASENDFFFCSISGAGYCYPFEAYGQSTSNPNKVLSDYFKLTAQNMVLLDLDMMGLYTHPNTTNGKWTTTDEQIFINFIEPMEGLKSVISGMHRTGYNGYQANTYYRNYNRDITVHHTLTFWPTTGGFSSPGEFANEMYDDESVNFLENEIKTYGAGTNFIQAMFYSWVYGPRRLKKLKDKMEPQGYVFLTLNEFDAIYRKSRNLVTNVNTIATEESEIECFPNPVGDTLHFSKDVKGTISLYNLKGKIVIQIKSEGTNSIGIEGIQSGIYILELKNDLGVQKHKVVIQK
tara:strand:+ start:9614 stop:11581 length:1968 start_codon:yes stop_codon:yes gene_type:complete